MEFSRPEYWSGEPFPSPGDLPNSGIKSRSPALQADSLPAEPQGNPMNAGVASLYLLQRIFLTQESNWESNWGLQYCRWILYQLSYQGTQESKTQDQIQWIKCKYAYISSKEEKFLDLRNKEGTQSHIKARAEFQWHAGLRCVYRF